MIEWLVNLITRECFDGVFCLNPLFSMNVVRLSYVTGDCLKKMAQMGNFPRRREGPLPPRPPPAWDEQQAYEELLYWDNLMQEGHRLHPQDYDR